MNVDWELLREQKLALLSIMRGDFTPIYNEELEGIVNFIEAFQDWPIDQGNATAEEVFGE